MKKLSRMLAVVMTAALLTAGASTALAARPDDAKVYADFNNGPMAEPEQTMQATDEGGALYINDGPIDSKAELSDGALKLTLGPTGYYGMQNGAVQFRDIDGKLTAYKYLVVRMKGEKGQENVSGNGVLMMSIGGGDGSHIGTFNAEAAGGPTPFLDPDGKTMPTITTEYQDFVIALTEDNVRKNPGKAVTGINFNNSVGQLTVYIDEIYLTNINLFSLRLINDNGLYQLLADDALPLEEKQAQYRAKIDGLADWSLIAEVVVVDRDGQVFTAGRNEALSGRPDPQLTAALEADSRMLRLGGVRRDSAGTAYLGFGRSYTYYSTSKWMGNLFIYVPEAALYSAVKGAVAEDGQALVLDGSGQVLACADKSRVGAMLFDDYPLEGEGFRYHEQTYRGKPSIFAVKDIAGVRDILGGSLCTMTIRPEESLYRGLNRLTLIIVGVEAAVILIALLLSWRISRRVVMPVHRLQDKLNAFGSGDELEPVFLHPSGDELMELEDTYNQMIERITDLVRTNNEEKIEQRKLQLIALQAQINPHFLYNTLDTIVWIAKIKKQKEIEDLAMALAGFFRISLHKGDKYMRVREELEFVRNFVMIQQIRFPEKFEVEYQVEEDILDCKILKIVIQPFVENAIKHGVAPKPGKGHIRITGKKENEDLVFEILDDGVGFREGDEGPKNGEADGLNGYGVSNVDERLKLEYGEDYGVTVTSCPGEGTRVVLRMRQMFYPAAG